MKQHHPRRESRRAFKVEWADRKAKREARRQEQELRRLKQQSRAINAEERREG